ICDGNVLVDSSDVRIEKVSGLTLQWNQMSNRIDSLRFRQGGVMKLNRGGRIIELTLPGAERSAPSANATAVKPPMPNIEIPRARAMQPTSIVMMTADEAADEIRQEGRGMTANRAISVKPGGKRAPLGQLRTAEELAAAVGKLRSEARSGTAAVVSEPGTPPTVPTRSRKRVDTYHAVFHNEVVVEQIDGNQTVGKIEADRLEVNFDFGKKQRTIAGVPTPSASAQGREDAAVAAPAPNRPTFTSPEEEDKTKLILTWNGPLELNPLQVDPSEQTGERFDVIATGSPVRLFSQQQENEGHAVCRQLVYRNESRQAWLSGTDSLPVQFRLGEDSRMSAKEVFFDKKRGLLRIDGEGTMVSTRGSASYGMGLAALPPTDDETAAADTRKRDPVEIRWSHGVDLEFGLSDSVAINPTTGLRETRQKEFPRRAWFHGDVTIRQGANSIAGNELAITFAAPEATGDPAGPIEHIDAQGDVRIENENDLIAADHLEVQMGVTPNGRFAPRIADASGNVLARQGSFEFRADQMHAVLVTDPDDSSTRLELLEASKNVRVRNPSRNLKITRADSLKAVFRDGNQLVRATIVSPNADTFARVRVDNVAIHGRRIEIDGDAQSIDVAGPGRLYVPTKRDFGGGRLNSRVIMKTSWDSHMKLRLAQNYGVFVGNVRSRSIDNPENQLQSFALDCERMKVNFARRPPEIEKKKRERDKGILERLLAAATGEDAGSGLFESDSSSNMEQKEPIYIVAEGGAVALASRYEVPDAKGAKGRLLSRMHIAGDQIIADLRREQVSVPSAGTMLIEDYQVDTGGKTRLGPARPNAGPLLSSAQGDGPSQTAIRWRNGMDFFRDRQLIVFDKDVQIDHRSGLQMVLKKDLASAMNIDSQSMRLGAGRNASLTCGNLLLEFATSEANEKRAGDDGLVRATDLKRIIARHAVHLDDGTKSLMGDQLQYLAETDEVVLEGSDALTARIIEQDETSQRFNMWKGPILIWNRQTNRIDAPEPRFRSGRR
ncbi:MAG: hypothetical protein O7B26_10155, partial [Planctomycetota bacterium]|nr:hypothetical protein [Planctomycetota bacterium]